MSEIIADYNNTTGIASFSFTATNDMGFCLQLGSWAVTHKNGVLLGLSNQPAWMTVTESGVLTSVSLYTLSVTFEVDVTQAFTGEGDDSVYTVVFEVERADCSGETVRCSFPLSQAVLNACTPSAVGPTGCVTVAAVAGAELVDLSWTKLAIPGLTGYRIYRDSVMVHDLTLAELADPDNPAYQDTGLTTGVEYDYQVKAYDGEGQESAACNTASATPTAPNPTHLITRYDSGGKTWIYATPTDGLPSTVDWQQVFDFSTLVGSATGLSWRFDFDTGLIHLHSSSAQKVWTIDPATWTAQEVLTGKAWTQGKWDVCPSVQKYVYKSGSQVRAVGYDGTGDTLVGDYTYATPNWYTLQSCVWDRFNDRVIILCSQHTSSGYYGHVIERNIDGSGESMLNAWPAVLGNSVVQACITGQGTGVVGGMDATHMHNWVFDPEAYNLIGSPATSSLFDVNPDTDMIYMVVANLKERSLDGTTTNTVTAPVGPTNPSSPLLIVI